MEASLATTATTPEGVTNLIAVFLLLRKVGIKAPCVSTVSRLMTAQCRLSSKDAAHSMPSRCPVLAAARNPASCERRIKQGRNKAKASGIRMRKKCMSVSELHRDEVASLGALSNLVCGGLNI